MCQNIHMTLQTALQLGSERPKCEGKGDGPSKRNRVSEDEEEDPQLLF